MWLQKINIGDSGYSSFNVAWGKCNDCKHEVIITPCHWNIPKDDIISSWNTANDPVILRAMYESKISELKIKIDNLPK